MGSSSVRLQGLTDENQIDIERLLYQHECKLSFPLSILRKKEMEDIVSSLGKDVFCRVAVSDGDVSGAIVAEKSVWDSSHFGFGVGKIRRVVVSDILKGQNAVKVHEVLIKSCMTWMKKNEVKCVMTRVDLDNADDTVPYDKTGFQLADALLTYHLDVQAVEQAPDLQSGESIAVRSSRTEDVAPLMEIARTSFTNDHFHRDPRFPQDKSDELFAKWVYNGCQGSADIVLVAADENEEPCGFIICKTEEAGRGSKYGVIDLIAVSPSHQRRGIGTRLVKEAVRWFAQSVESVFVGTQANNIPSIRTYEKVGFRLLRTQLTLHRWF
jgi:ribosomal-protein-alanine N-acetyltransferase